MGEFVLKLKDVVSDDILLLRLTLDNKSIEFAVNNTGNGDRFLNSLRSAIDKCKNLLEEENEFKS